MANPLVQQHLHFYPEDAGTAVSEYYQARHWHEINGKNVYKAAPMAEICQQHYFLYEPCVLHDGSVCIPFEWFYRNGILFANVWAMHSVHKSEHGWIVEEFQRHEVCKSDFTLNFTGRGPAPRHFICLMP